MAFVSIGDLSSSFQLRYYNASLKMQANRLGGELVLGKHQDVAASQNGDVSRLSAFSRSITMADTYRQTLSEIDNRASAMQTALETMRALAEKSGPEFRQAATLASNQSVSIGGQNALGNLSMVIGAANVKTAGRYLFAGQSVHQPPIIAAGDLLNTLETLVSGAISAADVKTLVSDFFNQTGGGFETSVYRGSAKMTGPTRISDSETLALPYTASGAGVRSGIEGFALAALVTRGIPSNDVAEQAKLLDFSGGVLSRASSDLVQTQAEIGSLQNRADATQVRLQAERSAVLVVKNGIEQVNPYATATGLQAVQGQLDALYLVTSRLSQLSLTRYLK